MAWSSTVVNKPPASGVEEDGGIVALQAVRVGSFDIDAVLAGEVWRGDLKVRRPRGDAKPFPWRESASTA